MDRQRVLAIGLDGMELSLAEQLMAAGEMPALAALRERSAWFPLAYGPAQRTGLAWEHVASGRSPDEGRRWAAVEFDPRTYATWQEGARFTPWWSAMDRRVVVFDPPYVDLERSPTTRGIVGWGAHDPGTEQAGRPADLVADFEKRVGAYPAPAFTYALPWPSAARTQATGAALVDALRVRTDAARWLAAERLPDWDLFLAVEGELHGATEGMWHGIDPDHPLRDHASAPAAREAILELYRGLDAMVAALVGAAGDAAVVAFTMGGMGANHSDVASMVLLPELLYRNAFGRPLLRIPEAWSADPAGVPNMTGELTWGQLARTWFPDASAGSGLAKPVRSMLRRLRRRLGPSAAGGPAGGATRNLNWQPASRYRDHWPSMPAFAIPSFYDGRIRLNLRGRERNGTIEPARYEATLRELEELLSACRNPRTGEPAVASFERAATSDPLALSGSEADLQVVWNGVVLALDHPRLGLVGPLPMRRTGGHTGMHGVAYIAAGGVQPGAREVRSAFDVVPTIAALLGAEMPVGTSGTSLL